VEEDLKIAKMKFTLSLISNPLQERDISESAHIFSFVLKVNVNGLEF
jgi:hypothetical protein